MKLDVLITNPSRDYELIDSGDGMKLERYGQFILMRPDPQALWKKSKPAAMWNSADAIYNNSAKGKGQWEIAPHVLAENKEKLLHAWNVLFDDIHVKARLTPFKHTCIFPEQYTNWTWSRDLIKKRTALLKRDNRKGPIRILNLFAYTGAATVAALLEGAEVTHVDSSKGAIQWAKENYESTFSGAHLQHGKTSVGHTHEEKPPVHFILDDVRKFVAREKKRGNLYHGIIMDPPAYGHGANRETWIIEEHLMPFIEDCLSLLHPQEPLFFLINGYSAGYSALSYREQLTHLHAKFGGNLQAGELAIAESDHIEGKVGKEAKKGNFEPNRALPAGIFARWGAAE